MENNLESRADNEKKARQWSRAWNVCRATALAGLISAPASVAVQEFNDAPIERASWLEHEINDCHRYAETLDRCSNLTDEYNRITASKEYLDARIIYNSTNYAGFTGLGLLITGLFGIVLAKRKTEEYQAALDKDKGGK